MAAPVAKEYCNFLIYTILRYWLIVELITNSSHRDFPGNIRKKIWIRIIYRLSNRKNHGRLRRHFKIILISLNQKSYVSKLYFYMVECYLHSPFFSRYSSFLKMETIAKKYVDWNPAYIIKEIWHMVTSIWYRNKMFVIDKVFTVSSTYHVETNFKHLIRRHN